MVLSEETTTLLHKNTIQYLHDIAERVPNTLEILKSYYASKFRISELQTKIRVQKSKNKVNVLCPRCCLKLRRPNASYVVKPETKKSKFAQKVLKKVNSNKRLSRYQRKYLKKNDLKPGNQLVVTCSFCKKDVNFQCLKPETPKPAEVIHISAKNEKKKPKKKKDKFCGLQMAAVASAQSQGKKKKLKKKENSCQKNNAKHEETPPKVKQNKANRLKQKIKQKKNNRMLNKMLKENVKLKSNGKNGLSKFLQSLGK